MATTESTIKDLLDQTAVLKASYQALVVSQKDLPAKLLADWIDAKAKIDAIHAALVNQGWIKP